MIERATTHGIQIEVESSFVPEHSDVPASEFIFSYRIRIQNLSKLTVRLLNRHWFITDGHGRVEEVKGPGVVGQQPELIPGAIFEYESFCPLPTPAGTMHGRYEMIVKNESETAATDRFHVEIPQFFLVERSHFH